MDPAKGIPDPVTEVAGGTRGRGKRRSGALPWRPPLGWQVQDERDREIREERTLRCRKESGAERPGVGGGGSGGLVAGGSGGERDRLPGRAGAWGRASSGTRRRSFGPRWASQGPIWVLEGLRGWERLGRCGEATWQRGTGWRARGGDVEGGDWQDGGFR